MEDHSQEPLQPSRSVALPTANPSGGSPSVSSVAEEEDEDDLFEPVSLRDLVPDSAPSSLRSSFSEDLARFSLATSELIEEPLSEADPADRLNDPDSGSPGVGMIKPSLSSGNFDSFPSPVGSLPKPRAKSPMLNIPQELVHLVDAAIMGRPESLERLQAILSDSGGGDIGDISRSVVDALLATMGGIDDLDNSTRRGSNGDPPSVMLSSRAAVVAAELVPWLPREGDTEYQLSSRSRMVKGLLTVLQSCSRNRAMCTDSGLLGALLYSAEKVFAGTGDSNLWDTTSLCQCIQVLGGHSLPVADLYRWLELIRKTLTTEWALRLTLALEMAMVSKHMRGPSCTFEFDGESSGLLGPGESRWPFSNGYAFATWLYVESFADTLNTATVAATIAAAAAARSGKSSAISAAAAASALAGEGTTHMPRLFSFLSSDNNGVEAYFHGQFLVVESSGGKGKKASLHFTYAFKPQCWYFIGLEHICKQGLIGRADSELKLYIDGSLHETRPFEFPRISKPLAFCCIGTNPPPTIAGLQRRRRQCPLFAEMGPVYIFREPIGPEKMARLASRGGDSLPCFGSGAGVPWLGNNEHVRGLAEESWKLDRDIGPSLHLLYHPTLLNGRFCPDASPAGAAGLLRRPAEVLGLVHIATRVRPSESLWALAHGGPLVLLPLTVSSVQKDNLEPQFGSSCAPSTTSLSAPIFRIISSAIQHSSNYDELSRNWAPELLSRILRYLLQCLSPLHTGTQNGMSDEELVAAVVSLCQSQKNDQLLKVQFFSTLLLDLKMWCPCSYGLQKKLLSSLADMVFTESSAMREANALQMLLDGCRRCYWVVKEPDSVDTFSLREAPRPIGELNALVDELLVVIELLIGAASSLFAAADVRILIGFLNDCPQANQVARVLHLFYRLVVQPNTSRANTYAHSFISCGGIETLLLLLQKETKSGNHRILDNSTINSDMSSQSYGQVISDQKERNHENIVEQPNKQETILPEDSSRFSKLSSGDSSPTTIEKRTSISETQLLKNLGGISFSISSEGARNNVFNIDNGDGVIVGIISLLGALVAADHLKLSGYAALLVLPGTVLSSGVSDEGSTMFGDKVNFLTYALLKAFQTAPDRLMTANVYMALMRAVINVSSHDDGLNIYDYGHRFEHRELLLVLLRSLPYASRAFQVRAIQDLLFLACSHSENRSNLTCMEEWPEWILEVLISNYELGLNKSSNAVSIGEIEDLIHNFLIIMLEHSMRQKDGWKDVESTIHCAEWLCMVGGSSTGDQRIRREESLPIFKRRLLSGLLDFAARELQVQQTQLIASAAAGVAAEGLSPQEAKAEAEYAAHLSVALAENAIVILMLVEDHLRLQGQLYCSSHSVDGSASPSALSSRSNSQSRAGGELLDYIGSKRSLPSGDMGGLPLDVLASMADANGQISAAVMERLTAAAAAEPYDSVRCAFASYGSCTSDLALGWRFRSRMWYGVGLPNKSSVFGGGGSGWEAWKSVLEKDSEGSWIELSLVKMSVSMLEALLLDETGIGGGLGIGGGSGTGMGGMIGLYQLLDSDQPFLCMLRMVLVSMREEDDGSDDILMMNTSMKEDIKEGLVSRSVKPFFVDNNSVTTRKHRSALLWSVLSPILNMPISESRRQRVLVACCILYSEVWHAVGGDGKPLRKKYLESILPPFVAILRRWRPLLAGIHELTSSDGQNPLIVDDRALAADALPLEGALSMISPGWASAFASPPAALALAMIAAGAAGGDALTPIRNTPLSRRDTSLLERRTTRLHTFTSFQRPDVPHTSPSVPKDKAAAKAAALAAARDLERNAKIGSGRGLGAVAMATSAQRRSASDVERAKRWNISEAMGTAWAECLQSVDSKSLSGRDFSALSYKYVAVLVSSFALARNMQRMEMDRRTLVDGIDQHRAFVGSRAWRKLVHFLVKMDRLFGLFRDQISCPERVFWKLDFMESSSRMRRYLKRNYKGSDHLGASVDYEDKKDGLHKHSENQNGLHVNDHDASLASNLPSAASIAIVEALSIGEGTEEDELIETENADNSADNHQQLSSTSDQSKVPLGYRVSGASVDQHLVQDTSLGSGLLPCESDERIILELPSFMVRTLKVVRGIFQVTSKRINFVSDRHTNDNKDEATIYNSEDFHNVDLGKDRSWSLSSLHQVFSRRYLLRRSALELFMVDRSNFFFDFLSIEGRKNAYRAIVQSKPPHLSNIFLATQKPEQLLKRTQLMERWARWEISNFEYLMELNTLAGRSYNDITQYPVFPWILADYTSDMLDLENPSSYRDLSKPIGALNLERLKKFQERYSSFDDPIIPKFHYGSHYSSAGMVLYYLVRMEPFTTLSIQLQGGKFDHADRMFSDIGATWAGVLEDMSDVKELVPEMFYLPEILTNVNSIDFGTTQLGEKLDSVKIPPWAENAVDFIHKHRAALESEHVSEHLHEWVDIIFGYKQRGNEAVISNNVFFYLTYEGTVDIDKITDTAQRRAMQDQISYFGQTPSQLLTIPHIKKKPLSDALHLQTIFRNPTEIKQYMVPNSERCNLPAGVVLASHDAMVVVDGNAPAITVALHKWQPNTPDGQGTPFLFQHGKSSGGSTGGGFMRMFKGSSGSNLDEWVFPRALAFAATGIRSSNVVAITHDKDVITGGHADNSIKLITPDGAKTIETAVGHCAPVTCLSLSPDSNYLVTGSSDTTVVLWRIRRSLSSNTNNILDPSTTTPSTTPPSSPLSTPTKVSNSGPDSGWRQRIEGPLRVLRGHLGDVVCCSVSADLGLVASCSSTSGVLLHSLRRGRLMQKLDVWDGDAIYLSSKGVILIWSKISQKLSTFTINGTPISSSHLSISFGKVSCIAISGDGENVVLGTSCDSENQTVEGIPEFVEANENSNVEVGEAVLDVELEGRTISVPSICFLNLHTLKVFHHIVLGEGQDVTALALSHDNSNLVVSTADKQLLVFTDPALSLKVVDQMLRLGWEGDGLLNKP